MINKQTLTFLLIFSALTLTACNTSLTANTPNTMDATQTTQMANTEENAVQVPLGGNIQAAMQSEDKLKMSRALDKAPGKSTEWLNQATGIHYTVTPVRKVVLPNSPYCRQYTITATHGSNNQSVSGTACVSEEGIWEVV